VICRLLKEKEELQHMTSLTNDKLEEYKSELASQVHQGGANGAGYFRKDIEGEGIYKELVSRMEQLNEILSKQRPDIKPPKTYIKKETIKNLHEVGAHPIHESTKLGIIDLDIHPTQEEFILSIGKDQKAILFDSKRGSIVKKINPFQGKKNIAATVCRFVPGQQGLFSVFGAANGQGNLWHWDTEADKYEVRYEFASHKAAITGISFQPLNEYAAFASKDGTWSFHNLFQGVKLA
jgi:pre-mRNA-processing factor 19